MIVTGGNVGRLPIMSMAATRERGVYGMHGVLILFATYIFWYHNCSKNPQIFQESYQNLAIRNFVPKYLSIRCLRNKINFHLETFFF